VSAGIRAIGVDVGGTKTAALRVSADGSVLARSVLSTPAEDERGTVAAIVAAATEVLTADVGAVGIAAAGLVEAPAGILRFAPNLAWRELKLVDEIGGSLGLPTIAENDATSAAWAEVQFGAARGRRDALFVGVGTGIGGGIVSDGRLVRGAYGFAGEIGHIVVEPDGPLCGCGNHGCLEQVASGTAIRRQGRRAATRHPHSLIAELSEGDPERVTGELVTDAAQQGDAAAMGILTEVGFRLGQGIAGLVNVLDPEIVVVGGGAADAGDLLLEPVRDAYRRHVEGRHHRPEVPIVPAELGNDAGAVGAAALALHAIENAP
jgi:glucokinase